MQRDRINFSNLLLADSKMSWMKKIILRDLKAKKMRMQIKQKLS